MRCLRSGGKPPRYFAGLCRVELLSLPHPERALQQAAQQSPEPAPQGREVPVQCIREPIGGNRSPLCYTQTAGIQVQ